MVGSNERQDDIVKWLHSIGQEEIAARIDEHMFSRDFQKYNEIGSEKVIVDSSITDLNRPEKGKGTDEL